MSRRSSQRDRILELLRRRAPDRVPLPELLGLQIGQYNARIKELRALGYGIESGSEWHNGKRHSWFRLVIAANAKLYQHEESKPADTGTLFGDLTPEIGHRDDG